MRGMAVVVAAATPASDEVLQVLGRGVQFVGQGLQVLRLQSVVLGEGLDHFVFNWGNKCVFV